MFKAMEDCPVPAVQQLIQLSQDTGFYEEPNYEKYLEVIRTLKIRHPVVQPDPLEIEGEES